MQDVTDLQDEAFEGTTRESLLDVVQERLQKTGKSKLISRLIYVARFIRKEQSVEAHKTFHSKIIEKHQDGEVSGFLLCYPWCMIHLIEARTSSLMSILRDTLNSGQQNHGMVEARVIASTEDIPSRCFEGWHAAFVSSGSHASQMDPVDSTTIVKDATEVNNFMRKVGPSLLGLSEIELRRKLYALESFFDDVPAPELVLALVPAEDAPTLDEYLDIFDVPLSIDLDSEQVWPMPSHPRI
ncbi:hypothetical protein DUNSADRAFT_5384 [Dunaliella salina]|uniref:BLUF domain-containing protein n=1 Tax=Dunaliella salina TaxID=3046 RepID=A0ABQ7GQB7_DUNSA|nr:hypothetical protein DUNSADRAFT_5384 [Dunaliella salina]|eukprot:KAF5836805.1 hypothetical protein DUNSADRAFT_5384 [Dunaliella salina]